MSSFLQPEWLLQERGLWRLVGYSLRSLRDIWSKYAQLSFLKIYVSGLRGHDNGSPKSAHPS
jgi:hypothetical protein